MKRTHWLGLGGLAVAGAVRAAGALAVGDDAVAQSTPDEAPAPLYAGVDSIGARPNPQAETPALYFEARAHWPSLGIETPRTAWEYAQRGIYRQEQLDDLAGALEDYHRAEALDDHLLIVQARLAYLALERGRAAEREGAPSDADLAYQEAIARYDAVLYEQPDRQGLRLRVAEAHLGRARAGTPDEAGRAEATLREELTLAPTQQVAFYMLGMLYAEQGRAPEAREMLEAYLDESARQGEPYPYKRLEAQRVLQDL